MPAPPTQDTALSVLRAMHDGGALYRVRLSHDGIPSHEQPHRVLLRHPRTRLADDIIDPRTVTLLEQRGLIHASFESWDSTVYELTGAGRAALEVNQ